MAFDIAAFITSAKVGLIPHAKHGARGVRSFAVCGSKFDGTGFEKEHIVQIQVAVLAGDGSGVGRWKGLSIRDGDAVALLDGPLRLEIARFWIEDRFIGLGTRVIFGDDFKKPPCIALADERASTLSASRSYIELVSFHILQINSCRILSRIAIVHIAYPM